MNSALKPDQTAGGQRAQQGDGDIDKFQWHMTRLAEILFTIYLFDLRVDFCTPVKFY
jgi:hypothetical protein